MRLATARIRGTAQGLSRAWRHGGRLGRLVMVIYLVLALAILCAIVATFSLVPATASSSALAGLPVPPGQLPAVKSAAMSCPELNPPRVAAQLMTASKFNPHATAAGGGSGVAGLTLAQWKQWIPAPGDARSNVSANIVALAHDVCDLAGQVFAAGVPGDQWRLALAAFHSGIAAVTAARGIPAGAVAYVNTVVAYASWYAQQPQFGGHGVATPATASPATTPAAPAARAAPSTTPGAPAGPSAAGAADPAGGWRLTWSDEFSGPAGQAPSASNWSDDLGGGGWGNSELEDYTSSTANAAVNGHGQLAITARQEDPPGSSCWSGPCRYTSARLVTLGHFSQAYGQISARIKLPSGQGIWPSFWALGDNFATAGSHGAGQMNILSFLGSKPATVNGGLIGPGYKESSADTLSSGTFADAYHTFTVDWYPDHISFFVDGHLYDSQYRRQAGAGWVFDHPFFLILNLAVGGTQPGSPSASTAFPQQMLVDWVRVYQAGPPTVSAEGAITGLAGHCVEASASGAVQLDGCNSSTAQTWTVGTDGTIRAGGQCLAVAGSANGAAAKLSACTGTAAQAWQAQTNGQLVNVQSGSCLDAPKNSSANLAPLQIWACGGTANQLWTLP
jgi:beta-glucanase (GH16 family)